MFQNSTPPDVNTALRRLLIVLAVVIGFVIYAYGWTVTDVDLDEPQEPLRQENTGNALRELLSPNIFTQPRELQELRAEFLIGCDSETTLAAPEDGQDVLDIEPNCGDPGDLVTFSVNGLEPRVEARVRWIPTDEDAQIRPREILETGREAFVLDRNGDFRGTIEVPRIRGSEGQVHIVSVRAAIPVGVPELSETSEQVIQRMAETIFMALVATSIAIPIAAFLSFFAARNLMQPIKLSVGTMLVAFIAFVLGIVLGGWLLGELGALGVEIGRGDDDGAVLSFLVPALVIAGTFGFLQVAARGGDRANGQGGPLNVVLPILVRLVIASVVIFLFGALGGLGLLGGEQINILADNIRPEDPNLLTIVADAIAAVGNLLLVLGELIELFITPLAAVVGGFVLSGIASDLLAPVLRVVPRLVSHVTGGVLGAVASAILFYVLGVLGTWAALLGLLAPITAALLGGQFVVMVYRFVVPRDLRKRRYEPNRIDDTVRLILFAAGAVIAFFIVFFYLNTRIALVNGILPSENTIEMLGFTIRRYIWDNIVIGFVLGALAGAASGVQTPFALGSTLYNVSRTVLNTIRSIEPLIMGLVFVIWVGIGPFAGVLALTLHSIAALGKLYSEQVENIDAGPVEALDSTGANRVQTIAYAVVPQIIPPYIAFTMYRWDINVRMSTIIGFVGGGGIGLLLQQQINLLRYRDAGVAVLAIAVVVSILDYASAWIRARIM